MQGKARLKVYRFSCKRHQAVQLTPRPSTPEKHLKKLLTKQRTTIEEIKTKTNYYSTKNLIDRYDEPASTRSTPLSSPALRRRSVVPNGGPAPGPPGTPTRVPPSIAVSSPS